MLERFGQLLAPDGRLIVYDIHTHIRENDYPESLESMAALAAQQGFTSCERVYRDEKEHYAGTSLLRRQNFCHSGLLS
ncbi:MAG: hypothetical protein ACJASX_004110 [Limisphaerales bacterium]